MWRPVHGARPRRSAAGDERGFTLIEVLVVILVLGVLAAIALPLFLGNRAKAQDAEAKSNARNLVSRVELCFAPNEDFRDCDSEAKLGGGLGVEYGSAPGQAEVTSARRDSYTVVAVSKADTGGVNHRFTIERSLGGRNERICSAGPADDEGGCRNGSW